MFQPQAVVERQLRVDAEVVLGVAAEVMGEQLQRGGDANRAQTSARRIPRRVTEKEAGKRVPVRSAVPVRIARRKAAIEMELASAVVERLEVEANQPVVHPELQRVAA